MSAILAFVVGILVGYMWGYIRGETQVFKEWNEWMKEEQT